MGKFIRERRLKGELLEELVGNTGQTAGNVGLGMGYRQTHPLFPHLSDVDLFVLLSQ